MIQRVPDAWPAPERGERSMASVVGLALFVIVGSTVGAAALVRVVAGVRGTRVEAIDVASIAGPAEAAGVEWPDLGAIREDDVRAWIERLADPALEGRDTPSPGLLRAQGLVAAEFEALGLRPLPPERAGSAGSGAGPVPEGERQPPPGLEDYFRPFAAEFAFFGRTPFERPDPAACGLSMVPASDDAPLELGVDFVPLAVSSLAEPVFRGEARGPLRFLGFGIDSEAEGYDDFAVTEVRGAIALVLDGEPEGGAIGPDAFGGAEVTAEASIWNKVDALAREGARGALVVRSGELSFRSTRAYWNPPTFDKVRRGIPTLEVSSAAASRLLGRDVEALRAAILASGGPLALAEGLPEVELRAGTFRARETLFNVVGWLPPTGVASAPDDRPLVIGAHLDHLGVGPRGRVGLGADDNASGVAALLAVARALAALPHRERGVVFAAFTGEEDDLLGSKQLAAELCAAPGARSAPVAMLNLDMIGRGPARELALFGLPTAADLRPRLELALSLEDRLPVGHGIERVTAVTDANFFRRSDHHAFHRRDVPVLFFFEEWPHLSPDYHTWRDTPESVDAGKVTRTARLVALIAATWLTDSNGLPGASR